MGKNPVVVVPSSEMVSLNLQPKVDILEDVQFTKAIPKSIKYFQIGSLKSANHKLEHTKS